MGEGVTEGAVGEEKVIKAGLRENVASWGGGSRAGAGGWAELAAEFETFEEPPPNRFYGGRVGFPLFVQVLQEGGVAGVPEAAERGGR